MPYIGNSPANVGNYNVIDDISSTFNGVLTQFALTINSGTSISPTQSAQLVINVSGIVQEPDTSGTNGFYVSGSTIVFSSPPLAADTFWGVFFGATLDIGVPSNGGVDTIHLADNAIVTAKIADNSITSAKLGVDVIVAEDVANNAITVAELADDAVTIAKLAATGTASSSTFLRGDNTWQAAGSTSASDLTSGTLPIARIADDAVTAAKLANSINTDIATGPAALPKAGGTMTGKLTGLASFNTAGIQLTGTTDIQSMGKIYMSGAGTKVDHIYIKNDGGTTICGTDKSTGAGLATGALAYASVFGSVSNTATQLITNNSAKVTVLGDGKVGIGVTDPDQALEVNGTIKGDAWVTTVANTEQGIQHAKVSWNSASNKTVATFNLGGHSAAAWTMWVTHSDWSNHSGGGRIVSGVMNSGYDSPGSIFTDHMSPNQFGGITFSIGTSSNTRTLLVSGGDSSGPNGVHIMMMACSPQSWTLAQS